MQKKRVVHPIEDYVGNEIPKVILRGLQVYAREHLDGKGCPKCEKGEKFIAKLKEKFGDKFGLDEFVYESSTTPVTLICPTHGAFSKLPNQILNLQFGCPHCGNDAKEVIHNAAVAKKTSSKGRKAEGY